jgi:hypothetical protein
VPRTLPSSSWYSVRLIAHLLGDLAFCGARPSFCSSLETADLDRALVLARAAREVVVAAQLVEHRAADALRREGLELHALGGVEARQRVGQADHADLDQVVDLDVGRQLGDHLVRQAPDQPLYCFSVEFRSS